MFELRDLLIQATDRIVSPQLEQVALQAARRRRTRRRGAQVAAVASAVVVTIVIGIQVGDRGNSQPPTSPSSQTPTTAPTTAPPASDAKVWPQWDPRDVDQLPAAPDRIAPALPKVIDPPTSSPLLSDDPITAAVLAVEQDGLAQVLSTTGAWRTVPIDGRLPHISLSPDGSRLAVTYSYNEKASEQDYAVTVHDLATGRTRKLQPPPGFEPPAPASWSFIDEDTLLFGSDPTSYSVAIDSGKAEETTAPSGMSTTVDPAGDWLSSADFTEPNVLTDNAGGTPREVSMDRTGRLSRIQASRDAVVGTSYDDQRYSVVVADRETLTPRFRLPVLDHEANYSNWGLGPVAIADNGTVLLEVAAIGRKLDGFRLVAWEPRSGALSIVSSTALPSFEASVVFAQTMLCAIGPD